MEWAVQMCLTDFLAVEDKVAALVIFIKNAHIQQHTSKWNSMKSQYAIAYDLNNGSVTCREHGR